MQKRYDPQTILTAIDFCIVFLFLYFTFVSVPYMMKKQPLPPPMWDLFTVDGHLYALKNRGGYGTEEGLYSSDDGGETWTSVDVPEKTRKLIEGNNIKFAVTSNGDLWRQKPSAMKWEKLDLKPPIPAEYQKIYIYDLIYIPDMGPCVAGLFGVRIYNDNGKLLNKFTPSGNLFGVTQLVPAGKDFIIASGNPFKVCVIDLKKQKIIPWEKGLAKNTPSGLSGAARIVPWGEEYLLITFDGVYKSKDLFTEWEKYIANKSPFDFIRGAAPVSIEKEEWLMADNAGIHLMTGKNKTKTIFKDDPNKASLVMNLFNFNKEFYSSFARLPDGIIGLKIGDLRKTEFLYLKLKNKPDALNKKLPGKD